jgi:hypothetical protein
MGNIIAAAIAISKSTLKMVMLVAIAFVVSGAVAAPIANQVRDLKDGVALLKDFQTIPVLDNSAMVGRKPGQIQNLEAGASLLNVVPTLPEFPNAPAVADSILET